MRIGAAVRKHRIRDLDTWRGVRNASGRVALDENLTMLVGPARDGAPLEMGILDPDGDDPVVLHAMPLRPKFYPFLN